jgi:LmbE family N-acetylglucosaminyl deacetylase
MIKRENDMDIVLFISVHPDDETLGCGGTILRHKELGDHIYWLNIANMSLSHPHGFSKERVDHINKTVDRVSELYGFEKTVNLDLYEALLDEYPMFDFIQKIDEVIHDVQPQVIYIPNRSDVQSDHRIAFEAIYACTKNFRKPYIRKLLMYETLSETEYAPALSQNAFIPNVFIDISPYLEKKIAIMKLYDIEIMEYPLPRSPHAIRGLAAFRGSRIGVKYAEAFQLLFQIG